MQDLRLKFNQKKAITATVSVMMAVFLVVLFIGINLNDTWHQTEIIETTDDYIVFQRQLIDVMETGSDLLRGYEAYIQVKGFLTDEETRDYLNYLTGDDMFYIRNIAIIEDTTIIYNHPIEENRGSIGVDLAQVPEQRNVILATKENKKRAFQGPVNLVQGGRGYIMRQPLLNSDTSYWGQVSIVIKADEIEGAINGYAEDAGLSVVIYEDETKTRLIMGDDRVLNQQPLSFKLSAELNDWMVYVVPSGGWESHLKNNVFLALGGLIVALGIGAAVYYFMKVNYNLQRNIAHDQMTGLYNRYYLEVVEDKLFDNEKLGGERFGMLHIDLDHFKSINDLYGHVAGDEVLVETARVLKKLSREEDLVFRVGGDEFMIILPGMRNIKAVNGFRSRILKEFKEAYRLWDTYEVNIGPSIGASAYPEGGDNFDEVVKKADEEMYAMKRKTTK